MSQETMGQLFALAAALIWAFALVFFRYSGRTVNPLSLNLFKNVVGIVLLLATLALPYLGVPILADEATLDADMLHWSFIVVLAISGIVGIALADTLFFAALNVVGVGIISIVDCLYSPFVILSAFLLLGEGLTWLQAGGAALIIAGVLTASRHPPPPDTTRRQIVIGVLLGAAALASMAFGIVMAKPVLEEMPLLWAAAIRVIAGTLALALTALWSANRRIHWAIFRPSAVWKTAIPAGVFGMYLAYVCWVAGFKYADASIAGVLNQTSVMFAIILATLILREPMTRQKLLAVSLAAAGVLVVVLHREIHASVGAWLTAVAD